MEREQILRVIFSSSTPYEYSLNDVIEEWILQKIPFSKDTFSAICERLVDLIMQKYENCENIITNIRHITHFLNQSNYNIRIFHRIAGKMDIMGLIILSPPIIKLPICYVY